MCRQYINLRSSLINTCYSCLGVQGYSFMAPSILFKRNVVMDDPVELCAGSEKPGSAAVARSAMMKVPAFPGTDTLQLMPVVKDRRPFLLSPIHYFTVFDCTQIPFSDMSHFVLIFFMDSLVLTRKKKLSEMVAVH